MLILKCQVCGRVKKIKSNGMRVKTQYGKKINSNHVCDYKEVTLNTAFKHHAKHGQGTRERII